MNYISIKQILDRLLRHPLLKEVTFEQAVDYTVDFIRIVGMPKAFMNKTQEVNIEEYRGKLPCDLEQVVQVRLKNNDNYQIFRASTDNFHFSNNKRDSYDLTYKLQGNCIFTSIKEGTIEVSYNAIAVDKEGYPMVPDNSIFIRALELYIKKQYFTILFDLNKLTPAVYNNTQQEYAWAVGQAQSELVRPTIDEMQAITNSLNTLVVRYNEHSEGFINHGSEEKIKLQ